MHFSQTLQNSIHTPWAAQYIDYAKLKRLLREGEREADADAQPWTEADENAFCDEILNVQLEKVAAFQAEKFRELSARADRFGEGLRDLAPPVEEEEEGEEGEGKDKDKQDGDKEGKGAEDKKGKGKATDYSKSEITKGRLKEIEEGLDGIINEMRELKRYSAINYTGFLKIVKKHDRKRGSRYKIRPMVMVSLARRPFNSEEGYAPLANRLSVLYWAVRQQLEGAGTGMDGVEGVEGTERRVGEEKYTAYKCEFLCFFFLVFQGGDDEGEDMRIWANLYAVWVHQDNLLEVKTFILRRLPVLVYSEQSSIGADAGDPTLNSLYFDNREFTLYNEKVGRQADASSVRVRWYGQLSANPELVIEHKTINKNGGMEEKRFHLKEKYIQPFIKGEYAMEKTIQKMQRQGQPEEKVQAFKSTVDDIQKFIRENDLQPVLRANYTRTAFQKPLDDQVRISIDTNVAFIREDSLDSDRPCRNPDNWHREDVDNSSMVYPFPNVNRGEISLFPHAILEIKVREDGAKKQPQWIEDLMVSHLVHKAPLFSKFVHGVAALFEDHVNNLPFWTSAVEMDIRKDPQAAFEEEEERKAEKAENEMIVGSLLGTSKPGASYKAAVSSPLGKSFMQERLAAEESASRRAGKGKAKESEEELPRAGGSRYGYGTLTSVLPSFSISKYAQSRRERVIHLPPGVTKPLILIKDSGPLQVEPKVWLANERTFLKWQHISILLGGLAVGLYTAAGGDTVAELMGMSYIVIAIFAGLWGYTMHRVRRNMIVARSGKDFDNLVGPMIVSVALMIALVLNFVFKVSDVCLV